MADDEARAGKVTSHGTLDFWELRYKVQSEISTSGSGDGVGTYSHGTTGVTDFVPNAAVVTLGMYLYATSAFDGTSGVWQAIYDGPSAPSGGYIVGGSSFETTVSMEVRMKGARLYVMQGGALPRIMWDSLDVYANGVFYVTLGPGVDMVGFGTGPNYVPVLGMPLEVTGGCSAGRAETTPWVYNPCDPDNADGRDWESSAEQTVSGGWQYREYDGGPWIDLPLKAFSDSVPSGSNCPFGIGSPEVAATRTYGTLLEGASSASYAFEYAGKIARTQIDRLMCGPVVVHESGGQASIGPDPCTGEIGPVFQDHYKTTTTSEGKSGTVRLQPDLGPSLERFAEDYAKLHLRGPGFPQTKATLARSCSETSGGVTTGGTFTSNPEVHPAMATFLGLVRDGDHAVLDALDYHSYAPASAGKTQSYSVGYSYPGTVVVQCPSPGAPPTVPCEDDDFVPTWVCEDTTTFPDPEGASESASISFPTSVGYVGNYQGHDEAMPRYLGTWGNPLWHLFDYRRDWYLQGDDAAWAPSEDGLGYWGPIRTQVAYDPALPEDERPGTRIDMIGAPYYDWAHTPIFDAYTGGYPWSGMSRFHVREVGFPATVALTGASDPMLSCPDASCVVISDAGGITLSPSGADPLVIDIDLCRFDCYPYLGLLLAKQVNFPAWSNVGSVTARLLSSFASGSVAIDGGATSVPSSIRKSAPSSMPHVPA
ncbi:hypothetical protein EON79_16155 [bacterium]|nr:MAG: hypothetical protein EON79_16155 [bacterium]